MVIRLIAIFIFASTPAWSQTTGTTNNTDITSYSADGASRVSGRALGEVNATATFFYGGRSGLSTDTCVQPEGSTIPCCDSKSNSSVCSNCQGNLASCNSRRIHDDLLLTIQFRPPASSSTTGGVAFLTNNIDEGQFGAERVPIVSQDPAGLIIPNGTTLVSITVRWGDICTNLFKGTGAPTGCDDATPSSVVVRLGIDENNDGQATEAGITEAQIVLADLTVSSQALCQEGDPSFNDVCNFRAFPGDKKVFIESVRADCSFPSSVGTNGTANALRVFYEEVNDAGGGNSPTNSSPSKDLTLGTNSGSCDNSREIALAENEVDGLTNGQTYRFSIGFLDAANNLGGILDTDDLSNPVNTVDETNESSCFAADADAPGNCHVVTPDQVIGLIEKEFDCFIASAAFGSPFQGKVQDFREFRNQYLHPSWMGQKIIKFYYRNSPPVARWLDQNPTAKPIARVLLYPLWLFAIACLNSPILVILTLLGLLGFVLRRSFRKGVQ